jgi:hypothetical protein
MEVTMSKSTRRALQFDSLEGKILLSSGMADPAAVVYRQKTVRFILSGAISGTPSGIVGPSGYIISSFPVSGHLTSMGNVSGAFYLKNTFVRFGKMPDLSKASLVLSNQKGSVAIALDASGSHHYKFKVMSGTGTYTYASGKGTLVISARHNSLAFSIKIHSVNG